MHNREGPRVRSREISLADGAVLVPVIAVILFLALYPQLALHRSEPSAKASAASAHVAAGPTLRAASAATPRQAPSCEPGVTPCPGRYGPSKP